MKQIKLENFRCYTNQVIRFKPGINLLIGDNASGKTSVLKACKYVLSAFFAGFSDENTRWLNPASEDFQQVQRNGIIQPEKPIRISFNIDDIILYPDLLEHPGSLFNTSGTRIDREFQLQKNSKKNSRALVEGIKPYKLYAKRMMETLFGDTFFDSQVKALPLFACFSTEDIHSSRKIDASRFKGYAQKNSFGYYECLDSNGFYPYWLKRLLVLEEGEKNLEEVDIVQRAIMKALGREGCNIITRMVVRANKRKVYYVFSDGREVEADLLSDGYRRLVNVVTDIAFRCALLNRGIYGIESAERTIGTVLIDEVDLHLHPTLQTTVLKGLRNAFPNIQFIVTTHAPMVMTGVENNEENIVYKLSYSETEGYKVEETDTYGMDSSTITEVVLNQTPRDIEVERMLTQLFDLIDQEQADKAKVFLHEMQERFGDSLPELAQAEAMLNFSIVDDNEENS